MENRVHLVTLMGLLLAMVAIIFGPAYYRKANYTQVKGKIITSTIKCYEWEIARDRRISKHKTPFYEVSCPINVYLTERVQDGGPVAHMFGNSKAIGKIEDYTYEYISPVDSKTYTGQMSRDMSILTGTSSLQKQVVIMAHKSIANKSLCDNEIFD
jgi:hypothetical protein